MRLGLPTDATKEEILAAYRSKARVLHPDIPGTGDTKSFVAVKQAYDVLSNATARDAYDRDARRAAIASTEAEITAPQTIHTMAPRRSETIVSRAPRLSDIPLPLWLGVALVIIVGTYQVLMRLHDAETPKSRTPIPATAAVVAPQSTTARHEALYGPQPIYLPGNANFYVAPSATRTKLYQLQPDQKTLLPTTDLPPFSSVEALRLFRQNGMIEIVTGEHTTGFVQAQHLSPGNRVVARQAYCTYYAGAAPFDGEILQRGVSGKDSLQVENHSVQPAVLRLRTHTGALAVSVFLAPGGQAELEWLPAGELRQEIAIGELWSRACNSFVAGMRAWRLEDTVRVPYSSVLIVNDENGNPNAERMQDDAFAQQ
jgi:curved DNA-binding protein CbpA